MFTPKQLDEITFDRATFGGYDVDAVDKVLEPLTQDYAVLYNENVMLKKKMRALIMKMKEQQQASGESTAAQKALDNARRTAARIVLEAEAKAAQILSDAETAAETEIAEAAPVKAAPDQISAVQQRIGMCIDALEALKDDSDSTPVTVRRASIERPWMKFYPEDISQMPPVPPLSLNRYLKIMCREQENPVLHYYGTDISWELFSAMVDAAARAMRAAGLGEGAQIPLLLEAVPEYLVILLAAEKIGASVVCSGASVEENEEIIRATDARIMFAHDYIPQEAVDAYSDAGIERIILINPWKLTQKEQLPQHIISSLKRHYTGPKVTGGCVCLWDDFLSASRIYIGQTDAPQDITRPLLRLTCKDAQGNSFPVIHSAQTILGTIHQTVCCGSGGERTVWLTAAVSPASVDTVVSLMLAPICSGYTLILDPFVAEEDLDLELLRCKPGAWVLSSDRLKALMKSPRIGADYDMNHLQILTAGTEAVSDGLIWDVQRFLAAHNCAAAFSACYGREETGSAITLPAPDYEFGCGIIGIPMPLNVVGIFRGTEECGYNRRGEICVTGPGLAASSDVPSLIRHEDGLLWLHTGDFGYMNEEGVIYAPSRIPGEARTDGNPLRHLELELEAKLNSAVIPGLVDCFFLVTPDRKKADGLIPYLYAIVEEGCAPRTVRENVREALEHHTVELVPLPEESFRLLRASRTNL